MIVGETNREQDIAVNVVKAKQQTNTRSANKDQTVVLKKPKKMSLEACIEYINNDELVEITPLSIRLRKKILDTAERKKFDAKQKNAE
jgi:GTP-binding protein